MEHVPVVCGACVCTNAPVWFLYSVDVHACALPLCVLISSGLVAVVFQLDLNQGHLDREDFDLENVSRAGEIVQPLKARLTTKNVRENASIIATCMHACGTFS